jgi:hypothetical protein
LEVNIILVYNAANSTVTESGEEACRLKASITEELKFKIKINSKFC